jgi:dihydroorotase
MLVANGRVFYNGQFIEKDVLIEDGKIGKIANFETSEKEKIDEIIDAKGMLVLPALVDAHVHLREPGETHKEDFRTGTRAAIAGGIATVMDMPNNLVPITTRLRLLEKMKLAKQKAMCDVYFHFACGKDNFEEIKKLDPLSLKLYLFKTTRTDDIFIDDYGIIERHFENFDKEKTIVVHAEGKDVQKICELASKHKRKLHLAHATTMEEMETAHKNNATVEVTPHHLFLSKKDADRLGKLGKVYPALREESDRKKLFGNFEKIDCIATDHAPHTLEDKESGAAGFPGLETSFALMLDAYNKKLLKLESVIEKMGSRPAEIFGLKGIGKIEKGYAGNIIFADHRKEWAVKGEELETKCKWSPFEGKRLKGKVMATIYRGKLIYEEGEFLL